MYLKVHFDASNLNLFFYFLRYNLGPETMKKMVFIHENLPRVKDDIKVWKVGLEESKKYVEGTPQENDNDDEGEDEEFISQEIYDEPSESLLIEH